MGAVASASRLRRLGISVNVVFAIALALVTFVSIESPARAATFTVNSTADLVDINLGDGICLAANGLCTLRAAIQEANAHDGHDLIVVPAGHYLLTLAPNPNAPDPPEMDGLTCVNPGAGDRDGDLDITCPVTIQGAGKGVTIIEAGGPGPGLPPEALALDRLFEVHQSAGNVSISGLTLRNGYHEEAGGALANYSVGRLRLDNISVEGSTSGNNGGGLYHGEPIDIECSECVGGSYRLEITNSDFIGNHAENSGGGIYAQWGTVVVTGGTISDNVADSGAGLFAGGEQTEMGIPASVLVNGTTVSNNLAGDAGGGLLVIHEGSLTITNATISGNTAYDSGGGIAAGSKSDLEISGSTITGNIAVGEGGGLAAETEGAVTISSSTFSHNYAGRTLPSIEAPGEWEEGEGGGGGAFLGGSGPIFVSGSNFNHNHASGEGGGVMIENNGSVTISNGEVAYNFAHEGGGGIENAGMRVALSFLSIHDNTTTLDGGGIEGNGSGDFTISDSRIYNNTAENGGGFANQADGKTRVERTSIYNNRALIGGNDDTGLGGGIYGLGDASALYENVTISGNLAQVRGGGMYMDADADIYVYSSTISRNIAPDGSGIADEATDFNWPIYPSESVMFRNTIVAGNLLSPNCNFALGSLGGNLEDGDSCHFRGERDRVHTRILALDAIADNGGPVPTMALRAESFAVDGGVGPCPATDARGVARPQNGRCDSGAYEFTGPFLPPDTVPPDTWYVSGPIQNSENTSIFTFAGTDQPAADGESYTEDEDLLFECRLIELPFSEPPEPVDPNEPPGEEYAWVGCPSPWEIEIVEEGYFLFEVRAIDRAGNVDPTPWQELVGIGDDITPPDTFISGHPTNPSVGTTAVFTFYGEDDHTPAQWLEFECRLDSGDPQLWFECSSPWVYNNLAPGEHVFEVRATDAFDNIDATPAIYTWTIGPPTTCEQANITLFASADSYIDEAFPQDSYGLMEELVVRSGADGNARALVFFALPAELPDPAECPLLSAHLRLFSDGEPGRTLIAVPAITSWAEFGVSWLNQPVAGSPTASTTSGMGYREWIVTDAVNAAIGGAPHYGFIIYDANEGDVEGAEQVFSSRHVLLDPPLTQQPQLILRYGGEPIPIPDPPAPAGGETTVVCGQTITESIKLANSLWNCQFDGLVIGASDIVVDLNGHTIDGLNYLQTGQEDGLPVGIRNIGHTNVQIINGTVQEFGAGVQLMAGATFNQLTGLVLKSNAIAGVELVDADNGRQGNLIIGNLFIGNGEAAIYLHSGTEHAVITANTFDGNAGVTIHLLEARHITITDNQISGVVQDPRLGSDAGIVLESSSDNVITGNYIAETGDGGIMVELGSHRNLISGNTMTVAGDAGVVISDSDFNEVTNNVAHLSSDAGIAISGSNFTIVTGNDVRFNPIGIDVSSSSDSVIENNDANYASGSGFEIGGASFRNTIQNNVANFTMGDGIWIEVEAGPGQGNLIANNVTNANRGDGIAVEGAGHTITENSSNSNGGFGIIASSGNTDGGGNTASGNDEPQQCVGVVCGPGTPVANPFPDTTPPDTEILTAPTDGHGMLDIVSFTFTGSDNIAPPTALFFECRLDAPPDEELFPEMPDLEPPEMGDPDIFDPENWHECASPVVYYLLTPGPHKFEVRAIDPFDNVDPTPAVYEWTVTPAPPGPDSVAPIVTIFEAPSNPTTRNTSTFRFAASDNVTEGAYLTFECSVDFGELFDCASPFSATLGVGTHTFQVWATDLAGNTSEAATHAWEIVPKPPDMSPPDTTILTSPDRTTVETSATFTFSGNDPGGDDEAPPLTFECRLDITGPSGWTDCESPVSYGPLDVGEHTFQVRAVDAAGNADPSPATFQWVVTEAPVDAFVTCGQVVTQSIRLQNNLINCITDGLIVGAPNITIDLNGFTIDGEEVDETAGVRNDGFDSVTIRNGVIQEFAFGVALNPGSTFVIVEDMTLQLNSSAGVYLSNADDGSNGNVIRHNMFAANAYAVHLVNGSQHNLIRDNVVAGSDDGAIVLEGGSHNAVVDNIVAGTADAGIYFIGTSHNLLAGNIITGAGDTAVSIEQGSNFNRIEGNRIVASEAGIDLLDSDWNVVTGNIAILNGDRGVDIENSHNNVIANNDLRFNGTGIEISGSTGNLIEKNDTSDGNTGIELNDGATNNIIRHNVASGNDGAGISVEGEASAGYGNLIDGNIADNNVSTGIYIGSIGHVVANNKANHNGGYGIYAKEGTAAGTVIDAGGNTAIGNMGGGLDPITFQPVECYNIVCDGSDPVAVDKTAPETWFIQTPGDLDGDDWDDDDLPDDQTTSTSATFHFAGIDNATSVTFECRLDEFAGGAWTECTSPVTLTGLSLGFHLFEVRAIDFLGNVDPTPATYHWEIIAPPAGKAPKIRIDAHPGGASQNTTASFEFSSNEPGVAFWCSLDDDDFLPCFSGQTYSGLGFGPHTFRVKAIDGEGLESSIATHAWVIATPPTPQSVTCGRVILTSTLVTNDLLDCPGNGLVIGAGGIVLDLGGHTIDGIGQGAGILNNGHDHVIIINGSVQEFDYGVQLNPGTTHNVVSGIVASYIEFSVVHLTDADHNAIHDIHSTQSGVGVALTAGSGNNHVTGSSFSAGAAEGVTIFGSHGNVIENNVFSANSEAGVYLENATINSIIGNSFSGNSGPAVAITLQSHGTVVRNNVASGNSDGILIEESNNNVIRGNEIRSNSSGIAIEISSGNQIIANTVVINSGGIALQDGHNNLIAKNNVSGNSNSGIEIGGVSLSNQIVGNVASGNSGEGIAIGDAVPSGQGTLVEDNITNNNSGDGIFVAGGHTVRNNQANFNDGWGIYAESGSIDGGGNNALANSEPGQCFGVVCLIGPNPSAPDTWILTKPSNPSNSRNATFLFSGSDDTTPVYDLEFECRLTSNGGSPSAWVECENPWLYQNLAPGEHTFEVRAIDEFEFADETPASYTWVYEPLPPGVPPDTFIIFGPPSHTPRLEAFFRFDSDEPDVTFQCRIDPPDPDILTGGWSSCGDEEEMIVVGWYMAFYEFEDDEVGPHVFQVRAIDPEGNVDPTPATYHWTIFGSFAIIIDGPAFIPPDEPGEPAEGGETQDTTAHFVFIANVGGSEFRCSIDLQPFVNCNSGTFTRTGLSVGPHVFMVYAIADNYAQEEPTEYEWTILPAIDDVPPDTIIVTAPDDDSSDAFFTFTGTDNITSPVLLTFECRLDEPGDNGWEECVSPLNLYEFSQGFGPGEHVFEVRAVDFEDNVDPTLAVYTWTSTADVTPPTASIVSFSASTFGMSGYYDIDEDIYIVFTGADNATPLSMLVFECAIDDDDFEECEADPTHTIQNLERGEHTFYVRAVDLAGNVSEPAERTFFVVGPPITTIIDGPDPENPTEETTATFVFQADQDGLFGISYFCSLQGSEPEPCASPLLLIGLGGWTYTFEVYAVNQFGMEEDDPVEWTWTIDGPEDTSEPDTEILSGPDALTTSRTALFTFRSTELGSEFECALAPQNPNDSFSYSNCESPHLYEELPGGNHTFFVRAIDLRGNVDSTPAEYSWTVIGPPVTAITSGPDDTDSTTATFTFVSSVPGSTFFCALDVPPFVECTSPWTYEGLATGEHEFVVYAQIHYPELNLTLWDEEGDDWEWEIVAPTPLESWITSAPLSTSVANSATFEFELRFGYEGATFECSLDSPVAPPIDWVPCASPVTYVDLDPGPHTFRVRAVAGDTVEPTPSVYTWWILEPDTTPPVVTIHSGPPAETVLEEATFTFSANEMALYFECSLDGDEWNECVSPYIEEFEIGDYTLYVRAVDLSGNVGDPATHSWSVVPDVTPPETVITGGPQDGDIIASFAVEFFFTGTDDGTLPEELEFECRFDGVTEDDWYGCDSPELIEGDLLTDGPHTFEVRAIDAAGNIDPTPAGRTFTIWDTVPPEITIFEGPDDPSPVGIATFTFEADDPSADFFCALNSGSFDPCASPHEVTVGPGLHIVTIYALDPNGNPSELESWDWIAVGADAPIASIAGVFFINPLGTAVAIVFEVDQPLETIAAFECSLNDGSFEECESPHELQNLTPGEYWLVVRAVDALLNVGPPSAPVFWTVETAPETTLTLTPEATSTVGFATFAFASSKPGSTFECSLDDAPFAPCLGNPVTYSVGPGLHTFSVRARDALGAVDETPVTFTWSVTSPAPPASCGTLTLIATADSWIDQNSPSSNNGSDSNLKVQGKSGTDNFRALVSFNLPALPAGCSLQSAELQLFAKSSTGGRTLQAYTLGGSWTEGGVTWSNQPGTTGAAATTPSGNGWRSWNVTDQVIAIYDSSGSFTGFLIRDAIEGSGSAEQQFYSREESSNRPTLVLVFGAPAPDTFIFSGPDEETSDTSAVLMFASDQPATTFACSINDEPVEPCTSPLVIENLETGEQTFEVTATNFSGLSDPEPATHEWTILDAPDDVAPDTTIGSTSAITSSTSVAFEFGSDEDGVTFECALNGGAFEPCASPYELTGLAVGEYTLAVRAIDAAGNVDETPAERSWTILPTAVVTISSGPDATTYDLNATFAFSSESGVSFECSLDGVSWSDCASPYAGEFDLGAQTFHVRAIDVYGNAGAAATHEWTIVEPPDETAPVITSFAGPVDGSVEGPAEFTFEADDESALFWCALDGDDFSICASPLSLTVGPGDHLFALYAEDAAGNRSDTVTHAWTVIAAAPPVAVITSGPDAITLSQSATFTFTTDTGISFECSLNGATYAACASPYQLTGLTPGTYSLTVRAVDAFGQTGPASAAFEWTVDAAPETTIVSTPPASTTSSSATFSFVSNEPGSTFHCSLDNAPFAACSSPLIYGGLSVGAHTFQVRAVDANGFIDATPAAYTWSIVAPPPPPSCNTVTLTASGDAWVDQGSASSNNGSDSNLKVQAKSSGNMRAFVNFNLPALPSGCVLQSAELRLYAGSSKSGRTLHAFALAGSWTESSIRWNNQPGTTGAAAATSSGSGWRSWNVTDQMSAAGGGGFNGFLIRDANESGGGNEQQFYSREKSNNRPTLVLVFAAPPIDTYIISGPAAETTDTVAVLEFAADQPATSYQCSLNGSGFQPCASPLTIENLDLGGQTFAVRATNTSGQTDPDPAVHEWTIVEPPDETAPDTSISTTSPATTASASIVFTLESNEENVTYACALDGDDFTPCATPYELHGLGVGEHTIEARATDAAGNVDETPAAYTWTVTPTVETSIDSGPEAETVERSATFTFSTGDGVGFECSLDGAAFSPCASPKTYLNLSPGAHTFDVRAVDGEGIPDSSPAHAAWTVVATDTTPPNTLLDWTMVPPDGDTSGNANFYFTATEDGATFECRLDGGGWIPCASPQPYAALWIGDHVFQVRATDEAGNVDPTPAAYYWTVDSPAAPPVIGECSSQLTITAGADAWIDQDSKSTNKGTDSNLKVMSKNQKALRTLVYFNLPDLPEGCEIESATLRLYAGSSKSGRTLQALRITGSWTETGVNWNNQPATTGPAATTSSGNGNRDWNVIEQVEAIYDSGVNYGFMIRDANEGNDHEQQFNSREKSSNRPVLILTFRSSDATPPQTTIASGPASLTAETSATIGFSGSDAVTSAEDLTFECRLNDAEWTPCTSPVDFSGLAEGAYKFEVRATDEAGNVDATPARHRWTVDFPPETVIHSGPAATTESTLATFTFSANEADAYFRCKIDDGDWFYCSSPWQLGGLGLGEHTFRVRAFDDVGNGDPSSAGWTWTVVAPPADTTPPVITFTLTPSNPDGSGSAYFEFSISETVSGVTCRLDGDVVDCGATYTGLSTGWHTFTVDATDPAGNSGSATYTWEVIDTTPPDTGFAVSPAITTLDVAEFTFLSTEWPATFQYSLDGGITYFNVSGDYLQLTGLTPGDYTLLVRSIDSAGNVDPSPAVHTWTVLEPERADG